MKNYILPAILILTCLYHSTVIAQAEPELPEVIPPTPTVANLMQFEEVPVSHYTGKPDISLPIFNKMLDSKLNLNISLSYSTDGIKVDNRSSWTGTGWSLFAGGVISRTVIDLPDEMPYSHKKGVFHNNDYWNYENITDNNQKLKFNWNSTGSKSEKYDREPDLYQYQFLNYSGRFVIIKDGSGNLVPKLTVKGEPLHIEIVHDSNFTISAFIFTDPYGYRFVFDVVESTASEHFSGYDPHGSIGVGTVNNPSPGDIYIANSSWHLSSIQTSNEVELANFSYQTIAEAYTVSVNRTENTLLNADVIPLNNPYNLGVLLPRLSVSYFSTNSQTKKISKIEFPDGTYIDFLPKPNTVHPETAGGILETIRLWHKNNSLFKTFTLDYEITPVNERLWLTGLTETAGNVSDEHTLNYHNKSALPKFDSHLTDAWGYYSSIEFPLSSCGGSSTFNNSTIQTGLLTSIIYPTGGVKEFDFEHHSYSYFRNEQITYEDYMQNPRNIDTDVSQYNYSYYNNPHSLPLSITSITLDFEQDVYINSWVTSDADELQQEHQIEFEGSNYYRRVNLSGSCQILKNVPPGTYDIRLIATYQLNTDPYTIAGTLNVDYQKEKTNLKQEMIGGGVRIKEIRFKDHPNDPNPQRKVNYSYQDTSTPTLSSGVVDGLNNNISRGFKRIYNRTVAQFLLSNNSEGGSGCNSNSYPSPQYLIKESGVNVELSQGSYVGYRNVKVSETGNGYITYRFTSPYDYPTPENSLVLPKMDPMPNLDFKRGLLLEKRIYDNSHRILSKESYLKPNGQPDYDFVEDPIFISRNSVIPDSCGTKSLFDLFVYYSTSSYDPCCNPCQGFDPPNCGFLPQFNIEFKSGWAKLNSMTKTDYFYTSIGAQTSTTTKQTFEYNDINYQVSEQTTMFDEGGGQTSHKTKNYYPVDAVLPITYNTVVKDALVALNKVNEILITETFRNTVKKSMQVNRYKIFDVDQVLPEFVELGKDSDTPETRIQLDSYDEKGNPTQVAMAGGPKISYIYGYNDQYPVAKIENKELTMPNALVDAIHLASSPTGNESQLLTALDNLRNDSSMEGAMITTFTYKPLLGVSFITAPNGDRITYHYDAFGRLEAIKDKDGNYMEEYKYNYAKN